MFNPLISIIIPTFNRPQLLLQTVHNVLNQTWENIEIIIIDDGVDDKSKNIILSLNNNKIKYDNTNNIGCALARLKGVKISNGEFITFLDDDDKWDENYLMNQLKIFNKNPLLNMVICNYEINNKNNKRDIRNMENFTINFKKNIHERPGPFFQCCMFRRQIFNQMDELFDPNSVPSEDWDFFMNLSKQNLSIGFSNQVGFIWNLSNSSQSSNLLQEAKGLVYIINKHYKFIHEICGFIILSNHYRRIARIYEKLQDFTNVKYYYQKAFYVAPYWWKNIFYFIIIKLGKKTGLTCIYFFRKMRNSI